MIDKDLVGLGWRNEIGLEIGQEISRTGAVQCLEVLAEQYYSASERQLDGLRALAGLVPLTLHGVSMGLCSSHAVPDERLEAMARLVGRIQPRAWSEHLSLVRSAGVEVGHLAAPPRCMASVEATSINVQRARRVVGSLPILENVATLVVPPWSDMDECQWLSHIVKRTGVRLLLDLHNLYANAFNAGASASDWLDRLPLDAALQLHLSGGMRIPAPDGHERVLDDHVHDVPQEVFELLEEVACRAPQPLMVIIERDGRYPGMDALIGQLEAAKDALRRGRLRRMSCTQQGEDKT